MIWDELPQPKPLIVHGHKIQILIDGADATHLVLDATLGSDPAHGVTFSPIINLNPIVYPDWDGQLSYSNWKQSQYTKPIVKIHAGEYIVSKKDVLEMKGLPIEDMWMGPPETATLASEDEKMERIAKKMIDKQKGKEN